MQGALFGELGAMMGQEGARTVEEMVQSASDTRSGIAATIISFVLLVIAATTVLAEVQDALNVIWKAKAPEISGWWSWVRSRLLSLALIGAVAFLLLVSLAVSAAMTAFGEYVAGEGSSVLLEALNQSIIQGSEVDLLVCSRSAEMFNVVHQAKKAVLWAHDLAMHRHHTPVLMTTACSCSPSRC